VSHWGDAQVLASLTASVVLLVSFVLIEMRSSHPLLPMRVLADRNRAGAYLVMLCIATGLFGLFFFLTLFIQIVLGYSAIRAGIAYLPFAVGVVIASSLAAPLVARTGPRPLILVGCAMVAGGMFWFSRLSGVDQGGDGEPAARGLSRESDVQRSRAVLQEGFVDGQSVVDRRRVRVFWGEPEVDGDDLGARPPADLRGQAGSLESVPQDVHAAVEVQDDMARFDSVDRDLGGGDAAQRGCGHGHVGGQRLGRGQLPEQLPLLADVHVGGKG
jgi:hypothetical protein